MIDIKRANKAFDEYVKKYDPQNLKILLKINHIKRVSEISRRYATELGLGQEDIELAELIGLLHDIGRFEQIRLYDTFSDAKSVNHGEEGCKVLFEDGLIRNFIEDDQYDNIIKKAVINHNRNKIEEGLTERELLHAKIVRDSDKTDIFYVLLYDKDEACYGTQDMSKEVITPEIYREFMEERSIIYKNLVSPADDLLCYFAYVFDYNFKIGLEILKEQGYIEKLYNRFTFEDKSTQKMLENVYKATKEFIEKKEDI